MRNQVELSRLLAVLTSAILAVTSIVGSSAPALANTASNPTIVFDGNSLASSVPPTESATRVSADSLFLSTQSLARTSSTARAGYSFGGWALTQGGAATSSITTATTSDTSRTLYAVWNTTLTYNLNGADSGLPAGGVTSTTYRFWQTLTLPTVGTMVKSGFAFGGWMSSSISSNRANTYMASADASGNPTLFAAWIKTVTFNGNNATSGSVPSSQVFLSGGTALRLPVLSEMTLRKPGYDFMGWSTTTNGAPVNNPGSYVPLLSQQTLFAIWRVKSTQSISRVFFKPGKATLQSEQKLVLRDLVDTLRGKSAIRISLSATHARSDARSIGKARNTAVLNYLSSLGVVATYSRTNSIGKANLSSSQKNNRVTIEARWTNPTN